MEETIKANPFIKNEPSDDIEQAIQRHLVQTDNQDGCCIDFVDLSNDEYFSEFQNFVAGIRDHRQKSTADLRKCTRQRGNRAKEVMSLQVTHLQRADFHQDSYLCSLFGIDFKSVMVYGRVTPGSIREANNTRVYCLDDGTGTVEVHYAHGMKKDVDNLTAVNKCESILSSRTPLNEEEVPEDPKQKSELALLLRLIKERCQKQLRYFALGTHCFAIGRLFLNRSDKVSVYAYSMYADQDSTDRTSEILWKTYLAKCYEEQYLPKQGMQVSESAR